MRPIDEVEHIRTLLRTGSMMTHEQKMRLIAQIRKNAIIDIEKIRPETIMEGHDLTLPHQAYHFISELRKEVIPLELAALLALIEACTRTVDNGQINENAICAAYAKTDGYLITGEKFNAGRKPNTGSVIRKRIAGMLKKNHAMKNPELWAAVSVRPPRGWTAYDNHVGKYLEGTKADDNMGYSRFCNVCSEERKKIKR